MFYSQLLRILSKAETSSDFSIKKKKSLWLLNREWGRESLIAISSIRARNDGARIWEVAMQVERSGPALLYIGGRT